MNSWLQALAQTDAPEVQLTAAGAVVMTASIVLVLSLSAFCLWRILSESSPETHHHAPLDIDTRDREP